MSVTCTRPSNRGDIPAVLGALADGGEDFGVDVHDFVNSVDRVCAIGRATGTLDGVRTAYGFVHCFTVADGVVLRFHEYVDPERAVYDR